MAAKRDLFWIDLTEQRYQRRLGLNRELIDGKFVYQRVPLAESVCAFPASIEEAAYLLVGLEHWDYRTDSYQSIDDEQPTFRGTKRLEKFLERNGVDVYLRLALDLKDGRLSDLTLPSIFDWVQANSPSPVFTHLPRDLLKQIGQVVALIRTGVPSIIRGVEPRDLKRGIEIAFGYRLENLDFNESGDYGPIDPKVGKKGQDTLRHRIQTKRAAEKWLDANPNGKRRDFMLTKEFREACEGVSYTERTIRDWVFNFPFCRKGGRPKGSLNRV